RCNESRVHQCGCCDASRPAELPSCRSAWAESADLHLPMTAQAGAAELPEELVPAEECEQCAPPAFVAAVRLAFVPTACLVAAFSLSAAEVDSIAARAHKRRPIL